MLIRINVSYNMKVLLLKNKYGVFLLLRPTVDIFIHNILIMFYYLQVLLFSKSVVINEFQIPCWRQTYNKNCIRKPCFVYTFTLCATFWCYFHLPKNCSKTVYFGCLQTRSFTYRNNVISRGFRQIITVIDVFETFARTSLHN